MTRLKIHFLLLLFFLWAAPACAEDDNVVVDLADILSPADEAGLADDHKKFLGRHDIDFRVVTHAGGSASAAKIYQSLDAGKYSKQQRGLLLLIDPAAKTAKLEMSPALEKIYSDDFRAQIEKEEPAALALAEKIFIHAEEQGPQEVLGSYLVALDDKTAALGDKPFYAQTTKTALIRKPLPEHYMKYQAKVIRTCPKGEWKIQNEHAVLRYPIDASKCPPYFFVLENSGWKLDTITQLIATDLSREGRWHFVLGAEHPYQFAFADWYVDKDGFPSAKRKLRWDMTLTTFPDIKMAVVQRVGKGSAAEILGFREGDRIVEWEGVRHANHKEIAERMDTLEPDEKFKVVIERKGYKMTLDGIAPPRIK